MALILLSKNTAFALPSFEIYCREGSASCTADKAYPSAGMASAMRAYYDPNLEIITVGGVKDVSGVLSVTAGIRDPKNPGRYMNQDNMAMQPFDDGAYSLAVDISGWPAGVYWVDISTTDNFSNNSMTLSGGTDYVKKTKFEIISAASNCATSSRGAEVCIDSSFPSLISSSTAGQTIRSLTTSISGSAITFTATLPATASGGTVYFIDPAVGFLGKAEKGSSAGVSFTYTDATWTGTHVIIAVYGGNAKTLNPSVATVTVTK